MHPVPAKVKDCSKTMKRCIKQAYLTLPRLCKSTAQLSILVLLGKDVFGQLRQIFLQLCFIRLGFLELSAQDGIAPFQVVNLSGC